MTTAVAAATPEKVKSMIDACSVGGMHVIQQLIAENPVYACQQDDATGGSPLMAAAATGNGTLCQYLLEAGAPWNAIDRQGKCAGDYATDHQHWGVVQLLVEWGTRSELILGMVERTRRSSNAVNVNLALQPTIRESSSSSRPVEHEPCTKSDFLRQRLHYTADGKALIDADSDGVMMEWERPLMKAHAQMLMEGLQTGNKRVMNIGFGMGIIDSALQEFNPELHIIVEAHPDVYKQMLEQGWDKRPNVRICFGKWQDCLPQLIREGLEVDGIFYDTYGEHFLDFEDFHSGMVHMLSKPYGRYSFFNGLAPDNLFFHGVACQCVKLQLGQLGLDCEFMSCEIQVKDHVWEGIRRRYWHGRDTYYLPHATWNPQFLATGTTPNAMEEVVRKKKTEGTDSSMEIESDGKRQRFGS